MPVQVEIHPDLRADIKSALANYPFTIDQLKADFAACMESGGLKIPSYMGCDQPYHEPAAARSGQLRHIHIALPPQKFKEKVCQAYRKCDKNLPHLDAALVYVQGELYEDRYMILAFFAPYAHEKAKVEEVMTRLGILAKAYRDAN
ncbi:type II toxin-antitoxin system YafO family toxin [Pseudomonas sichuanensis]|uniref:type II toxin-antitoxin system YafO family toxin n=1 Tax=Pseudomonas TaxID=286 RepID=UPI0036E5611C